MAQGTDSAGSTPVAPAPAPTPGPVTNAIELLKQIIAALMAALIAAGIFVHHPVRVTANLIEVLSGAWTVVLYTALGLLPFAFEVVR